jgi:putative endopeptidase
VQWTRVETARPEQELQQDERGELAKLAPGYDWKAALGAAGVGNKATT